MTTKNRRKVYGTKNKTEHSQGEAAFAKRMRQASTTAAKGNTRIVTIEPPRLGKLELRIVGVSPLLCNNKAAMAQSIAIGPDGRPVYATQGRKPRDPQAEYEASLYKLSGGGYGFPTIALKQAMASSVGKDFGVPVRKVYQYVLVHSSKGSPGYLRIHGEPKMHEAIVKQVRSPVMRYRACFVEWYADVTIEFELGQFSAENVANMVARAGRYVGIGDGRPEKKGHEYGCFKIE